MRSILIVPASNAAMVEKSLTLQSDQIVFDLEDSVITRDKAGARELLGQLLPKITSAKKLSIRFNEAENPESLKDATLLDLLAPGTLHSVILPKIHSTTDLDLWTTRLPAWLKFEVQIESARGLIESVHIADHSRVLSLAFGPADFMASMAMPSAEPGIPLNNVTRALDYPLQEIIIAARAAGKWVFDGPYFRFTDGSGFTQSAEIARGLGADGKWVIHPDQISECNRIFTPTESEVENAKRIIAAYSSSTGAVSLDGLMVDKASAQVAQRLLDRFNHFLG